MPLPNEFLNAENFYENGGYFAAGETLSRGMLKIKASDLNDKISSIASFITAIENKINNYSYQIRKLNSEYSEAAKNYQKAMIESGSR